MGRAEDLFEKIKKEGEKAIDELIQTRKSEELFLEFKCSANNGDGKYLNDHDRKHLAKAISGFGNSEGGIIVWGIDCSKGDDHTDIPKEKVLIKNVARFVSWLEGAVSGCTVPPHGGVQNYPIIIKDCEDGIAVTYVPKSNYAPHQSLHDDKYYIRAGSSFVPTPHSVLAGMFGRRPQPNVFSNYAIYPTKPNYNLNAIGAEIEVGLNLVNTGPGIAKDMFFKIDLSLPGPNCSYLPHTPPKWDRIRYWFRLCLISKPSLRLPPEGILELIKLKLILFPPFNNKLYIKGLCGCAQSPPYSFIIENNDLSIKKVYDEFINKISNGNITGEEGCNFTQSFLNIKNPT